MTRNAPLTLAALLFLVVPSPAHSAGSPGVAVPRIDDAFWAHWGDGRAEIATYDLTYPRYGATRSGTAVTIFVTEPFAPAPGVKSEDPRRPAAETLPVLKLNLIQDFPTGVYDYNLMTSAFVALAAGAGRDNGRTLKVSFSAQEWCGQSYAHAQIDPAGVRLVSHSYFDGEADAAVTLPSPPDGLAEDALLVWARGLLAPVLAPGATVEASLLRSLELGRLEHVRAAWDRGTLARSAESQSVTVPAGTFDVDERTVSVPTMTEPRSYPPARSATPLAPRTWTFLVERAWPHRVIRWSRSDGASAVLVASARIPYWKLNGPGLESALAELGLQPRAPRTP